MNSKSVNCHSPATVNIVQDGWRCGWQEQCWEVEWPLLPLFLSCRAAWQCIIWFWGREPRGFAAPPSAKTFRTLQPVWAGRAWLLAPCHPSSFPQGGGEEFGGHQPASPALLPTPGQFWHSGAQLWFVETFYLSHSVIICVPENELYLQWIVGCRHYLLEAIRLVGMLLEYNSCSTDMC